MKKMILWFINPPVTGSSMILIIRLMVGSIFLDEGILKYANVYQSIERFTKLGFISPEAAAHIIATGEIIGGLFLIFGLLTRMTAFYFIIQIAVAVLTMNIYSYFRINSLPVQAVLSKLSFLNALHEMRADYAQIITCLFLFIEGAGRLSLDFMVSTSKKVYRMSEK